MLDLQNLPRLDKSAVEQLLKDYSRNYLVYLLSQEGILQEMQETKDWFTNNSYDDPLVKPATNEVFKAKVEASLEWKEVDKMDLQNKAEWIKTAYTNKFLKLEDLMAEEIERPKKIQEMKSNIDKVVSILDHLNSL